MRFCPRCGSRYEHERFCPEDGAATEPLPAAGPSAEIADALEPRSKLELERRMSAPPQPASPRWPYVVGTGIALTGVIALVSALRGGGAMVPASVHPAPPAPTLPTLPSRPADSNLRRGVTEPSAGAIAVDSVPPGAEVLLDGASMGRAPVKLARPEQGSHALELRLAGYVSTRVRLTSDSPATLRLPLKRPSPPPPKKTVPPAPQPGTRDP